MNTTPTGVPLIDCGKCGGTHPETRGHCSECGRASLFLRSNSVCLRCAWGGT